MPKIKRKRQKKEQELKRKGFKENTKYQISFLVILVFILYGNTLFNKYSLDDSFVILNNKKVEKGILGIPEIFSSRYIDSKTDINMSTGYRPIVISTYAIEYELFGYAPVFSHFINIILYTLGCILLLLVLKRIFKDYHYLFPIIITTLFAAHPVHTEVVASLKNRDELIVLVSALYSMYLFIKYADYGKFYYFLTGLFFFIFACLSKPTVLPYIVVTPLVLYFFTNLKLNKVLLVTSCLIVVYLTVRYLPHYYLPKGFRPRLFYENNIRYENFFTRLTTGFYILLFYIKKLIIPFPLLYYYGYNMIPIVGISNIWVIISILFHLVIFGFAIYKIKQKHIFSFIIIFYLVSITPFSNVFKPIMGIVGERFLLTPSIAFSIFLGLIVYIIFKINPYQKNLINQNINKILFVVFIILIPYSAITINRNTKWKDYLTLYETDIKYLENSVKANELYATRLVNILESGDYNTKMQGEIKKKIKTHYTQSLKVYIQALRCYPEHHKIYYNIAILYSRLNKPLKSLQYLEKAIELKPDNILYHYNFGILYKQTKKNNQAYKSLKRCLELDSTYNAARILLSDIYLENKEYELAKKVNNEFVRFDSIAAKPHETLGFIYLQLGDTLKTIQHWETAVYKKSNNTDICRRLSIYFKEKQDYIKASYYQNMANKSVKTKTRKK